MVVYSENEGSSAPFQIRSKMAVGDRCGLTFYETNTNDNGEINFTRGSSNTEHTLSLKLGSIYSLYAKEGGISIPNTLEVSGNTTTSNVSFSGVLSGPTGSFTTLSATQGIFSGNVAVDTNVLYVDTTNNRVGVNNSSPTLAVDVVGSVRASNALISLGTLSVAGNVAIDTNTLYVDALNNRVGINDTTPSYELDVSGEIRATSNVYANYFSGQKVFLDSQVIPSGNTSCLFENIPSWVNEIVLNMINISANASTTMVVQLGDSGGIETTGYIGSTWGYAGSSANTDWGAGACIWNDNPIDATATITSQVRVSRLNTNNWTFSINSAQNDGSNSFVAAAAGYKATSATLTQIRLYTGNAGVIFDGGAINMCYY
jgi:hypothetical protein